MHKSTDILTFLKGDKTDTINTSPQTGWTLLNKDCNTVV